MSSLVDQWIPCICPFAPFAGAPPREGMNKPWSQDVCGVWRVCSFLLPTSLSSYKGMCYGVRYWTFPKGNRSTTPFRDERSRPTRVTQWWATLCWEWDVSSPQQCAKETLHFPMFPCVFLSKCITFCVCVCVSAWHSIHVQLRGHTVKAHFILLPCGPWESSLSP